MGSDSNFKFPVVNLKKESVKPGTNSWIETRKLVTRAFEDYGCFVAVHDLFSEELSDEIFRALQDLFDLPTEIKAQNTSQTPFFGYFLNPALPLYESTSIEDAANLKSIQSFTNLIWPSRNNHFSEILRSHTKRVIELEELVSKMVFESYAVQKYHDSHLRSQTRIVRFTKCRVPKDDEMNLGATAHSDKNFITMLNQNQVNGLEIQLKDGNWISVDFPPSSLVIMAGEAFSAWSNGRVLSPLHRVVMNAKRPRYSVAQFSYSTGIIRTPEELVDDEHPLLYKPFDNFGLLRFLATEEGWKADNLLKAYCGV